MNIFDIAFGVFVGEMLWGIVLFVSLYILIRILVRRVKRSIVDTGFRLSAKGTGLFSKVRFPRVDVNARHAAETYRRLYRNK